MTQSVWLMKTEFQLNSLKDFVLLNFLRCIMASIVNCKTFVIFVILLHLKKHTQNLPDSDQLEFGWLQRSENAKKLEEGEKATNQFEIAEQTVEWMALARFHSSKATWKRISERITDTHFRTFKWANETNWNS